VSKGGAKVISLLSTVSHHVSERGEGPFGRMTENRDYLCVWEAALDQGRGLGGIEIVGGEFTYCGLSINACELLLVGLTGSEE
jgi:hypothetical protein